MTRTKTLIAAAVGGLAALLLVGTALAHPGGGLADKVDVLARALGITAEEVEQAKQDGALTDLLADVSRGDLREAFETEATEAIDEAVTSGDITSTQADRLKEVVTADRSDLTDSDLETLKSLRGAIEVDRIAILASLLGKTSAEVEAAKTPQDAKGSSSEVRVVGTVIPGGGLVVAGAGSETAVQVADEAVGEGA